MEGPKKPRAREKKVVADGKGVEKQGEGLGTGPVNNAGNYQERRESQEKAGMSAGSGQRPYHSAVKQSGQRPYHSGVKQSGQRAAASDGQRAAGTGGGGKLMLIIVALVVLLGGGGGLSGLFGGSDDSGTSNTLTQSVNQTANQSLNQTQNQTTDTVASGLDIGNLLSSFLGSGSLSSYDYTGSSLSGSQSAASYFTSSDSGNTSTPDETVAGEAREKYTVIRGNNQDTVTILVYMCGTDLESQQGMGTSDLKEMANATIGSKVNLLVYTGGCKSWKNNVISSSVNQIYRISNGKFERLEENAGTGSMVNPETLVGFIQYGTENYPADRTCLIFWDHGGGSVTGYGYDEKTGSGQSMTLAGINSALEKAGVKFDFIGFDACLMATVENGLMLAKYGDYMIASEETEPGVGWYYTNWLTKLSSNTSMSTVQIGKLIADDFVSVCNQQCRGQATTLSVVDLAELQATIPQELKQFSISASEMIQNKEYKTISKARNSTREFAQSSRIDQIDLIDFANQLGTTAGKNLAGALQSAVKYNRTGGSMSRAYGLSIYFPYQRANKVNQMVSTYQAIGMDEEYTRCIQEFASLEISGQVSAGTSLSSYGSSSSAPQDLLSSLLGQQGSSASSYSAGSLSELLGGLYGGSGSGSTGSILDLFMGRSMTAESAVAYILDNHFDPSLLVWENGKITLGNEQWDLVTSLLMNVFYDDGGGFIDLGLDTTYESEGNSLLSDYDGTWLSVDGQPVAYYYLNTVEEGDDYVISGYVPAILNGEQVNLILNFDSERPDGYIAGAMKRYSEEESGTQAKELIAIGRGDVIQFVCDYFDYDGNYRDTYKLGEPITLGETVEIANTPVDQSRCRVTFRLTDIYQQNYWTPAIP